MTEAEWQSATDPAEMLEFLRGNATNRKLRLFNCAAIRDAESRLLPTPLAEPACHTAIQVAEQYADGLATADTLAEAHEKTRRVCTRLQSFARRALAKARGSRSDTVLRAYAPSGWAEAVDLTTSPDPHIYPHRLTIDAADGQYDVFDIMLQAEVYAKIFQGSGHFVRDIIGNPFRPVTLNPDWLSSTVIGLAECIYQVRAFDRMPILADALEEAGCDNSEVLNHCRHDEPHVRGCWVIDLLLGKS